MLYSLFFNPNPPPYPPSSLPFGVLLSFLPFFPSRNPVICFFYVFSHRLKNLEGGWDLSFGIDGSEGQTGFWGLAHSFVKMSLSFTIKR